jgi:hypothetical protein
VRAVGRLAETPAYCHAVDAEGLPAVAKHQPGCHSVMMAYDFHVTPEGPRLIEVNTNAGGSYLALLAQFGAEAVDFDHRFRRAAARAMATFAETFAHFTGDRTRAPGFAVVVDGRAQDGFSDPETHAFVAAMRDHWGCEVGLAEPGEAEFVDGVLRVGGAPVDFVYNRFCDFYMEAPEMEALRQAYLGCCACVTPNPRFFGLLGDKRRMRLWCDSDALRRLGVGADTAAFIAATVPHCALMTDFNRECLWESRKQWVFKPVSLYGGKGVIPGRAIRRTRFEALDPERTLVQAFVAPGLTPCEADGPRMLKTDIRLFAYRDRVLGVGARVYSGQITNFSTPGSGYARVEIQA